VNKAGHVQTLVARHPGNKNALKNGVYSERVRLERAEERLEQLRQLPHSLPDDHPLLDAIARQQVLLDLIDEDLARRGPTDRHGRVRSIVELRNRAVARLQRLLEAAGLTPEAQRRFEAEAERRALAAEIARHSEAEGKGDGVAAALKTIAFRPETTIAEKLRALQILSERADRKTRRELQQAAIDVSARRFSG
jgi:hypothetical protein